MSFGFYDLNCIRIKMRKKLIEKELVDRMEENIYTFYGLIQMIEMSTKKIMVQWVRKNV